MGSVFTKVSMCDKTDDPFVGDSMSHKKCMNR